MEFLRDSILKPSPSSSFNPHTNARVPLTIFDRAAFDLHVTILYAFRPPLPSNDAIITGLAEALNYYPHLAGRLATDEAGHACVILNGAGIRLVETRIESTLAERLPFEPAPELTRLHPPFEGVEELLQIQLNRYSCGGLVIGQTAHHRIADGQSMSFFFGAWGRLVRGLDVEMPPYHNRAGVTVPRSPPRCEFNHREIEFKQHSSSPSAGFSSSSIVNVVLHFSSEFMAQLKKQVSGGGSRYSTFECLLTHLWKKMTVARRLADDEMTQVRVAVNGRARMKPTVPMEYFGNLVLWAYPKLKVKDLLNESYSFVAKTIHDEVGRINDAYFRSFIDFGELSKGEELVESAAAMGNVLCPNLEVDSWLRFQFHELDFGGGGPCAFLPAEIPVEGLMLFVPSYKEKGAIDVFMTLTEDNMDLFKRVSHSLA